MENRLADAPYVPRPSVFRTVLGESRSRPPAVREVVATSCSSCKKQLGFLERMTASPSADGRLVCKDCVRRLEAEKAAARRRVEQERLAAKEAAIEEANRGILPAARQSQNVMNLEREEVVHHEVLSAQLMKVSRTYNRTYQGFSIPLGKTGIRYQVGSSKGQTIAGTLAVADTGVLVITSRRIIFNGLENSLVLPYSKLIDVKAFSDGVQFHRSDRKTPVLIRLGSETDIAAARLNAAIQKALGVWDGPERVSAVEPKVVEAAPEPGASTREGFSEIVAGIDSHVREHLRDDLAKAHVDDTEDGAPARESPPPPVANPEVKAFFGFANTEAMTLSSAIGVGGRFFVQVAQERFDDSPAMGLIGDNRGWRLLKPDSRLNPTVVILQGSVGWCARVASNLRETDYVAICLDEEGLEALKVPVVDKGAGESKQVWLDEVIDKWQVESGEIEVLEGGTVQVVLPSDITEFVAFCTDQISRIQGQLQKMTFHGDEDTRARIRGYFEAPADELAKKEAADLIRYVLSGDSGSWKARSPILDVLKVSESTSSKAAFQVWSGEFAPLLYQIFRTEDAAKRTEHAQEYAKRARQVARVASAFDGTTSKEELGRIRHLESHLGAEAPADPLLGSTAGQVERNVGEDVEAAGPMRSLPDVLADLEALVGLEEVKKEVHDLVNLLKIQRLRREHGLPLGEFTFHLVFLGNPGTGKTTVARLMAEIYSALDVVAKGHLVETDRADLVAGYVGQTAMKTDEVVKSALGGLLFIDEAYSLTQSTDNDFGSEAIATLLKLMEDHRDDLVVIVAGYTEPMLGFVKSNPGLESRFKTQLPFEDYSTEELVEIFESLCRRGKYDLDPQALSRTRAVIEAIPRDESFANARTVRQMFETALVAQANRISALGREVTESDLRALVAEDIEVP